MIKLLVVLIAFHKFSTNKTAENENQEKTFQYYSSIDTIHFSS